MVENPVLIERRRSTRGPWWAQFMATVGIPTFLLLWFFGALPFVPSPIVTQLLEHDKKTTRLSVLICKGVWKDRPDLWGACDQAGQ